MTSLWEMVRPTEIKLAVTAEGPGGCSRADTYLLFVVGEFALLVFFLDFVAIHPEPDSLFTFTRTVFFSRLSLLCRSVLLLQDPKIKRRPPTDNCPRAAAVLLTRASH